MCRTSHLAKDQATCAEEERTKIEVDPAEVLDIEINAPSGDEFQVSSRFICLDSIGDFFLRKLFPCFGIRSLEGADRASDREVKLDLLSLSSSLFVCVLTKLVLTACLVEGNAPLLSLWQN